MKVILLQDVKSLGKEGDSMNVKDGYAQNYLIPRKLAMMHTDGAIKILETKRKKAILAAEKEKKVQEELAQKISQLSLNIPMESGVNDTLFGTVTPDVIFKTLQQENIHVDKKSIEIAEPIRKLGVYNAEIRLHPDVKANLRIWVVKK